MKPPYSHPRRDAMPPRRLTQASSSHFRPPLVSFPRRCGGSHLSDDRKCALFLASSVPHCWRFCSAGTTVLDSAWLQYIYFHNFMTDMRSIDLIWFSSQSISQTLIVLFLTAAHHQRRRLAHVHHPSYASP